MHNVCKVLWEVKHGAKLLWTWSKVHFTAVRVEHYRMTTRRSVITLKNETIHSIDTVTVQCTRTCPRTLWSTRTRKLASINRLSSLGNTNSTVRGLCGDPIMANKVPRRGRNRTESDTAVVHRSSVYRVGNLCEHWPTDAVPLATMCMSVG